MLIECKQRIHRQVAPLHRTFLIGHLNLHIKTLIFKKNVTVYLLHPLSKSKFPAGSACMQQSSHALSWNVDLFAIVACGREIKASTVSVRYQTETKVWIGFEVTISKILTRQPD